MSTYRFDSGGSRSSCWRWAAATTVASTEEEAAEEVTVKLGGQIGSGCWLRTAEEAI